MFVSSLVFLFQHFSHETRGRPDSLIISHLPYGPTAYFTLSNVVSRHDIKEGLDAMSLVNPHLIFNGFTTQLGKVCQLQYDLFQRLFTKITSECKPY